MKGNFILITNMKYIMKNCNVFYPTWDNSKNLKATSRNKIENKYYNK